MQLISLLWLRNISIMCFNYYNLIFLAIKFYQTYGMSIHTAKNQMSRVVRKPVFCICENKDADQLRGNREADQRLCFRYTDSTIPLLPKSEISNL